MKGCLVWWITGLVTAGLIVGLYFVSPLLIEFLIRYLSLLPEWLLWILGLGTVIGGIYWTMEKYGVKP